MGTTLRRTPLIPDDLQEEFTRLTGIPMLSDSPPEPYSILNDPDTGIRLPGERNQRESRTHIALPSIRSLLQHTGLRAVITFDQSDYRRSELNRDQQGHAKLRFLADAGLFAFYYVSHAPFLFVFPDVGSERQLKERCEVSPFQKNVLKRTNETADLAPGNARKSIPFSGDFFGTKLAMA